MPSSVPRGSQVPRTPARSLADYAVRLHRSLGADHVATSPLGAYLLLAAVAPAATGPVREELEAVLGCPADEAAKFLAALITSPHPAVASAMAAWSAPHVVSEALDHWRRSLPAAVESGSIPGQAAANAWASECTRGMIERFPLQIGPRTVLLLASALATRALWLDPFDVAPATELGAAPWAGEVRHVLSAGAPGKSVIVATRAAGLVGVQVSRTIEDMLVISVIAEPGVAPADVIAAAHEVAANKSLQASSAEPRSLFDLPLGAGHAWDIVESEIEARSPGERRETARVLIPAWRASSPAIELMRDPALGFRAAADALFACLPPHPDGYEAQAVQATTASFGRYGFSAASVTAIGMALGCSMARFDGKGLLRHATVRFSRPFAVVAVTASEWERKRPGPSGPDPWDGLPVFTAWVTRPSEPEERTADWEDDAEHDPASASGLRRIGDLIRGAFTR